VSRALLVARWEYVTTVMRGSFIFAVLAMPLLYGTLFLLAAFAGRGATRASSSSAPPAAARIAIVDRAHVVDAEAAEETRPQSVLYGDLDRALEDLKAERITGVYVIEEGYLANGTIRAFYTQSSIFSIPADRQRQAAVSQAIRVSLLRGKVDGDLYDRTINPIGSIVRMDLAEDGTFKRTLNANNFGPFAGAFGIFMLFSMTIFFSAGFLQQATIADRQNRMIEILIASVSARDLVLGKLLGLAAAGLTQVTLYVLLIITPGALAFSMFQVTAATLLPSIAFFIAGYLIFACLMTATGMVGRTPQESAQISTIWMVVAGMPWFFFVNINAAPNGLVARTLSFFPLTSPIAMLMRIAGAGPSKTEIAAVLLVDAAAIYLIFTLATKIFRASSLMYGKRTTVRELFSALRSP
jgi:ABC-2 type transport system permease protein